MNHVPLLFLGVFAAFLASWWSLIFSTQVQIGTQPAAATADGSYPTRRLGVAEQGHAIYVANGCVHCHSQQVRQEGFTFDLVITAPGTNPPAVTRVLNRLAPDVNAANILAGATDETPQRVLKSVGFQAADTAREQLQKAGAKAQTVFIPLGPDIGRGWGARRTVGADYLVDHPVQIGNSRLGPDLANYGNRAPSDLLILQHLYDPRITMPGSLMPAYRYLFEERPIGRAPSARALPVPAEFAPAKGMEVIPKEEALQLLAYLKSLRADTPLFEAPMMVVRPPTGAGDTNNAATNAPANTPAP